MVLLLILSLFFQSNSLCVYASNENTYFARIMFEHVYLYKTPTENEDISNIYFELPKTYFVELLSKSNNFYEARYMDIIGYVKKDCVQTVANIPNNPFLCDRTFRVYAEYSEKLWSSPSSQEDSNLITVIPHLTQNIQFIGNIQGEPLITGRTNIWYYCKYSAETDQFGYIYSDFCDEISEVVENTEIIEYVSNPTFEVSQTINAIPEKSNYVGILIGILSIPALVFVFMVLKSTHILNTEKQQKKEVIDY